MILSKFYKMISIESNPEWMNKYESDYIFVPEKKIQSEVFGETIWLDQDIIKKSLNDKKYDMLIVDAGFDRVGIYDNLDLFNTNIPIIFDDTMADSYLECANLVGKKLNKKCETFQCKRNKYAVCWFEGKKFSLII